MKIVGRKVITNKVQSRWSVFFRNVLLSLCLVDEVLHSVEVIKLDADRGYGIKVNLMSMKKLHLHLNYASDIVKSCRVCSTRCSFLVKSNCRWKLYGGKLRLIVKKSMQISKLLLQPDLTLIRSNTKRKVSPYLCKFSWNRFLCAWSSTFRHFIGTTVIARGFTLL